MTDAGPDKDDNGSQPDSMPRKNPPHPGRIVRQDCLEPLGFTVTAAAEVLGATRQALNNLVNRKDRRRWPRACQSIRQQARNVAAPSGELRFGAGTPG